MTNFALTRNSSCVRVALLFAEDRQVPTLGAQHRGEAEIVEPADKFKPLAQLDKAEKFLWKEDFCGDTASEDYPMAVVVDCQSQAFIVGLRY